MAREQSRYNKKKFQSNRYDLRPLTKKLEEKIESSDINIMRQLDA